jgi:hypothetical protein
MTVRPFNKIEAGLERARLRQAHWRHVAACFAPHTPEHKQAKDRLEFFDTFIISETHLLHWLRRRLAIYEMFPAADMPADLARYLTQLTVPPRDPPR